MGGAVQPGQQLAVMPPTGGLGGAIQSAAQPAFQGGDGLGGLKAGVAPNSSNISPMPTMTHDLVQPAGAPVPMPIMGDTAPRFEGPRTGGPGIGPPPEMVQQPAPILSPAIGMEPRNMPMQQPAPMQQRMQMQQPMFRQPMMMPQYGGLQSLFNAMMMQQRMQPMRMPMYQSPALAFRPNIQQVQQNLSRVKPSVYQSDLDLARARIAELEARLAPPSDGGGGGGG